MRGMWNVNRNGIHTFGSRAGKVLPSHWRGRSRRQGPTNAEMRHARPWASATRAAVIGFGTGMVLMSVAIWAVSTMLLPDALSMTGGRLASGLVGLLFFMGSPVDAELSFPLPVGGGVNLSQVVSQAPLALLLLLVPLIATALSGYIVARDTPRSKRAASVLRTSVVFSGLSAASALLVRGSWLEIGGLAHVGLHPSLGPSTALGFAWAMIMGHLAATRQISYRGTSSAESGRVSARTRRQMPLLAALTVGLVIAGVLPASAQGSASTISAATRPIRPSADFLRPGVRDSLLALRRESTSTQVVTDPSEGVPTFVMTRSAATRKRTPAETAKSWLDSHRAAFAAEPSAETLRSRSIEEDDLGMVHATFDQVHRGVPVYGARVSVHFDANGRDVVAVSDSRRADVRISEVRARLTSDEAVARATLALPGGSTVEGPRLMVLPGDSVGGSLRRSALTWLVWLSDENVSNAYFVDARSGAIVHVEERTESARVRKVFDANNTSAGQLLREEGQGPSNVVDANSAYDFTGAAYDYFKSAFGRDSYDNQGATLLSTIRYRPSPSTVFANARWTGSQMQYGEGFAVKDVTAHELTHAVTDRSANLVYQGQSGALNESFSDIFGAMVDRDDWLIGEDIPGGAIRSMEDPAKFGDPANLAGFVTTCLDSGGVHTNSGIPNKAFVNYATSLGKDKAQQIAYRSLTIYLNPHSSFEDARAAAIRSSADLYGLGADTDAVRKAFDAVGLDGVAQPKASNCGGCGVLASLSGAGLAGLDTEGPRGEEILAVMYRTRDQLMPRSLAGDHYRQTWETDSGRIASLLLADDSLRRSAGGLLQDLAPGLSATLDGGGDDVIVSASLVAQAKTFLGQLEAADGGGSLAEDIASEQNRLDIDSLTGLSFDEALVRVSAMFSPEA